ncbi:MAG TPA: ATP-binding cassette domain-containing protein [Candidatus Saccharimonadales bacterium]|nr:ATP-binding cassette domain-containing protein [Candidatus Saccharimonadales bacterium]
MSGIIKANNLTKKFGDFVAVDDITFEVEKAEIFAFLGPNGAGKSTTIKMLTTLLVPTSGELSLAGYDVMHDQENVRKSFGIVFQDPSVDDELTAYENMELHAVLYGMSRGSAKSHIHELLKLVDLWERKDHRVRQFSGGMKRRLEIARGFLHSPKILFLDEPTIGLDTQTRTLLWDYVKKINKQNGTTIFFTTHYLEEAEAVAQRISIIDHGKIISSGTSKQLEKQTGTTSLEEAYLALTGREIRDEEANSSDRMRLRNRARRR